MRKLTPSSNLVIHLTRTTSAAAYLINRHACKVLLESINVISEQFDHALERPFENGLSVRAVRPLPAALAQNARKSTIDYADRKANRNISVARNFVLFKSRAYKEISRFVYGLYVFLKNE